MVLTNFECWANGSSHVSATADIELFPEFGADVAASRRVDLFNPRTVQQNLRPVSQMPSSSIDVSYISSNGYYGFSYLNAPTHELNSGNDNNNNNTCNYNFNSLPLRCKKRIFVNDDDLFVNIANAAAAVTDTDNNDRRNHDAAAAKRSRYDDDFAEQYFNDFLKIQTVAGAPLTEIGTQQCLMDTEEFMLPQLPQQQQQAQDHQKLTSTEQQQHHYQQQQEPQLQLQLQQVDVAMAISSLYTTNLPPSNAYQSSLQQEQQQRRQQLPPQLPPQQQQQTLASTIQQQRHQVHFQGHLHHANRDISRCLLSHMI